ncbi:MAG: hypothetical protein R2867_10930 [Caldilineaceae bacterium]
MFGDEREIRQIILFCRRRHNRERHAVQFHRGVDSETDIFKADLLPIVQPGKWCRYRFRRWRGNRCFLGGGGNLGRLALIGCRRRLCGLADSSEQTNCHHEDK